MATSSSILSYIDNVVSTYDSANTEAKYTNLKIANDSEFQNVDINGKAELEYLNVSTPSSTQVEQYRMPTTTPNSGDYISYNGVTNSSDGSLQLEFKNFNSSGVQVDQIGGIRLPTPLNQGTIIHVANSTIAMSADSQTESQVIDSKNPVLQSNLSLTDRLLISVDRPSGAVLYKMALRDLFQFIENSSSDVSKIGSLASNTEVNANHDSVTFLIDDGGVLERTSTINNTGMKLHGDLFFLTDTDTIANNSIEVAPAGNLLLRSGGVTNQLNIEVENTQNFHVKNTELTIGANFTLGNGSYIDLNDNSFIEMNQNSSLKVTAPSLVDLNQNLANTANVSFNQIIVSDPTNAVSTSSAPFILSGGGAVTLDFIVGNDLFIGNDLTVTNDISLVGDLTASGNVTTPYVDTSLVNTVDVVAANDITAGNTVFSQFGVITTSSAVLKTNIQNFENGLSHVMKMKPKMYNRKNNLNKNELGFIAEDMEQILPNIVQKVPNSEKGINYSQIIPVLVSAIQEQSKKIIELENKIK